MMRRPRGWSYRQELNNRVAAEMIANNYAPDDKPAISLVTSIIRDDLERRGVVTRKESDRLSQRVTIRDVGRLMRSKSMRRYEAQDYLNKDMLHAPTYKTVKWEDIRPYNNQMAYFRDRLYGTKENLSYRPKMVRLVQIQQ